MRHDAKDDSRDSHAGVGVGDQRDQHVEPPARQHAAQQRVGPRDRRSAIDDVAQHPVVRPAAGRAGLVARFDMLAQKREFRRNPRGIASLRHSPS